ncbi:MAG TPA: DNA/RNA non-specific endonuclease [Prolixibacteraceae bacterium]|jgi:endonuclease G
MKRFSLLLNVLLFSIIFFSTAQELPKSCCNKIEIPKYAKNDIVISHVGYSFLYNEEHEQASWVAYELTKEETNKLFNRTNRFKVDPMVKTGSANNSDFTGSGYDRGHLAPAGDMGWSSTAMAESFYYSNMSPQVPGFNRGIWKKLEELVRSWAIENNSILVVTGPVLKKGLKTIGPDHVSVPDLYYKVILDNHEPSIKGIAFLIPNASQSLGLQSFVASIDSVESVTGIDFFPRFPNEDKIERTSSIEQWSWTSTRTTNTLTANKASISVQCNGITKAGNRCRNKTLNLSGYCYLHETQSKK